MVNGAVERRGRGGFLVLNELVGERAPTQRARMRMAEGTSPGIDIGPERMPLRGADARHLRIRMVELLAAEADPEARAVAARQIASLGSPLPAGVLRALAALARDRDARVRRAAATTLVRLIEAMGAIERSELIGRLATSSRAEMRLLVALALRHGALEVGSLSALEHLVDDADPEVRCAALVSARLRLGEAPARLLPIVRRKLAR
jgi:hypothetical protein